MTFNLLTSSGLLTTSKAADKSSDDIAAHFPSSQIAAILDCISKHAVSVPQFFLKPYCESTARNHFLKVSKFKRNFITPLLVAKIF
jgi:hypothetical protein